jgi:ABC-type amino acid transport substrate-binding protein
MTQLNIPRSTWRYVLGLGVLAIIGIVVWQSIETPLTRQREEAFTSDTLRVGMDLSYPPFGYIQDDIAVGIDVLLAETLSQRLGLRLEIFPVSYDGLYDALLANRVDVVISALTVDARRTRDVLYSLPYFDNGLVFISDADMPLTYQNLSGQRIAFEFGSHADGEIREHVRRMNDVTLLPYEKPVYALDAVRLYMADGALTDTTTYRLYEYNTEWQSHSVSITHVPFAMAVHIDRIATFDMIQTTLISMLTDGTVDAMIEDGLRAYTLSP